MIDSVHVFNRLKSLHRHRVNGRKPEKELLLSKENIILYFKFSKEHLDTPLYYWENVLLTDVTNVELFGKNRQRYM
uniref:Uncharacterized protein n=1 Tax=Amphiprion percula TaxID=161767 RepID=A0A3P8ST46_AMPPE